MTNTMADVVLAGRTAEVLEELAVEVPCARVLRTREPVQALRLCGVDPASADLKALEVRAREQGVDLMVVPEGLSIGSFKVAAFDMDSTLTQNECIDEMASIAGVGEDVARITREAMEGKLPFAENLVRRVRILKGFRREDLDKVNAAVTLTPGVEDWIGFLKKHGLKIAIVTGGFNESASVLAERLGIDAWFANTLHWEGNALTGEVSGPAGGRILDADGKRRTLEVWCAAHHAMLSEAVSAGDGANDLEMIAAAGFGFAYHGKPVVAASAPHAVRFGPISVAKLAFVEAWEA